MPRPSSSALEALAGAFATLAVAVAGDTSASVPHDKWTVLMVRSLMEALGQQLISAQRRLQDTPDDTFAQAAEQSLRQLMRRQLLLCQHSTTKALYFTSCANARGVFTTAPDSQHLAELFAGEQAT
jgi:histone H3/H4